MYKVFIDNVPHLHEIEKEHELLEEYSGHEFIRAAGGVVEGPQGFLFIKRHGLWDIPKGKLKEGEAPTTAAVREVEEECGLVAPEIIFHLTDTWHTYEHKGNLVLKKTYWYCMQYDNSGMELNPQIEEGITEVRFFKADEFDEIKSNTYLSIIDVIECLTKHLEH